ncbi:hypothetical protein FN846DRAFT_889990 [Sphaerosporella brunnea]|uniref:Uncharacterized protein n=1 Tax=Sphaerosporella brunnea TaxID=1250544 RepID=A0A5J5EXY6_9PEZI|nr:hypothetical protein FN846DRAFT_889990 [Sphaerosporella brunnea]
MATFIGTACKGRADAADAVDGADAADASGATRKTPPHQQLTYWQRLAETTQAAGIYLPLPLYRALPGNKPIVPSPSTITASAQGQGEPPAPTTKSIRCDIIRRNLSIKREKKPENDNARKIPKVTGETSACDRVLLPGPALATDNQLPGLAVTPGQASVSAARQKTGSIYVDVSRYTGMDIARNISPDGTGSGFPTSQAHTRLPPSPPLNTPCIFPTNQPTHASTSASFQVYSPHHVTHNNPPLARSAYHKMATMVYIQNQHNIAPPLGNAKVHLTMGEAAIVNGWFPDEHPGHGGNPARWATALVALANDAALATLWPALFVGRPLQVVEGSVMFHILTQEAALVAGRGSSCAPSCRGADDSSSTAAASSAAAGTAASETGWEEFRPALGYGAEPRAPEAQPPDPVLPG